MRFALKNLFKQKGVTLIFGFTITIMMIICYIFLALLYNPYFSLLKTFNYEEMIMGAGTTIMIIVFAGCLIIYTNIYILETKNKEISLMRFHGMTNVKMILYQVYQNTFIYICAITIGVMIGYCITPHIIEFLYGLLNINNSVVIASEVFTESLIVMFCLYITSLILNVGYMYRGNLVKMLNNARQNKYRKSTVFGISSKFYLIIFIVGLMLTLFNEHTSVGYILYSILGSIGSYGIIKYYLPELIERLKRTKWLNNTEKLVVFGNLFLKFRFNGLLIQTFILLTIILITLICFNLNNNIEMYRTIIAYIIMLPMIIFCITYKNLIMIKKNKEYLRLINRMGVVDKSQKTLIKKEWLYFYLVITFLPSVYIIPILGRFYIYNQITLSIILIIVLYFIVNIVISLLICYRTSIKNINIKEV